MTKFGLMAVTALSLVMATPVMAMHGHHHHYGYYHALKHHFGSTYAAYGFYRGSDFARKNTFDSWLRKPGLDARALRRSSIFSSSNSTIRSYGRWRVPCSSRMGVPDIWS